MTISFVVIIIDFVEQWHSSADKKTNICSSFVVDNNVLVCTVVLYLPLMLTTQVGI
jgi:hypothetical protein